MARSAHPIGFFSLALFFVLPLLVLASCAAASRQPLFLEPGFASLGVEKVALFHVVFLSDASDPFLELRLGEEIRHQAAAVLEGKDYQVTLAREPRTGSTWKPYRLPGTNPESLAALARSAPEEADALVILWIDEIFEGDADHHGGRTLDLYGTAAMVSLPEGRQLWRDEASAVSSPLHSGPGPMGIPTALQAKILTERLFSTLPGPKGRR